MGDDIRSARLEDWKQWLCVGVERRDCQILKPDSCPKPDPCPALPCPALPCDPFPDQRINEHCFWMGVGSAAD